MRDVRFFASRALQAAGDGLRALFQHARRALVGLHAPAEGVRHLLVAEEKFHLRLRAEGATLDRVLRVMASSSAPSPIPGRKRRAMWPEMSTPNSSMARSAW